MEKTTMEKDRRLTDQLCLEQVLLSSVEGDADDLWPISPSYQEVLVETRPGEQVSTVDLACKTDPNAIAKPKRVLMAFGKSGRLNLLMRD